MSNDVEKKTSVARAITISGTMMLTNVSASNGRWNHFGARCSPSAAIVPKIDEMTAVQIATKKLLNRNPWIVLSARTLAYHLRLKPSHWVTRLVVPLKLNTTTTMIGMYRNAYTSSV